MSPTFHNQTIIITGAASGIGRATATLLHEQGATLSLWDVQAAPLAQLAAEFGCHSAVVDITDAAAVAETMQQFVQTHGRLTAVIHAAGILATGLFTNIPLEKQQLLVQVNLSGTINIAYHALPYLEQSKGSLITIASTSALFGPPEYASYGASKAGVLSLSQALAVENSAKGIHIGVVIPSFVDTPMNTNHNPGIKLYERFGVAHSAEDVARAIVKQGLQKRRFQIWPSIQPRLLYHFGLLTDPIGHFVMRLLWR